MKKCSFISNPQNKILFDISSIENILKKVVVMFLHHQAAKYYLLALRNILKLYLSYILETIKFVCHMKQFNLFILRPVKKMI
jgi:hypothetical protein